MEKRLKKRIRPNNFIQKATNNLNNIKSVKYGFAPEQIELKSINNREFKEEYTFHRLQNIKLDRDRRQKSDFKTDIKLKRAIRELVN